MSTLCQFCQSLANFVGANPVVKRLDMHDIFSRHEMVKWSSFSATALQCELCKLISGILEKQMKRNDHEREVVKDDLGDAPLEIVVVIWRIAVGPETGLSSWFSLNTKSDEQARFIVWADKNNSLVSQKVTTLPPILTNEPFEPMPMIRQWLQTCVREHSKCNKAISGDTLLDEESLELPTRVLYVAGKTAPNIQLIESGGMRGRYTALSHCWGDPTKHPMKTSKSNFERHLTHIPYSYLPKTFQDSVDICRGLGIDYLWIDSLCIIQDDHDDWEQESRRMGSVYEHATVMIGAAGAANSTEGCFSVTRPQSSVITARAPNSDNQFYMRQMSEAMTNASFGPLRGRGWATQEWYLSRRKVFFMPGGFSWACKEMELDERNTSHGSDLYDHISWLDFLDHYAGTALSKPSDRLVAIEGIATALRRGETRIYGYGVWLDNIALEILWACCERNSSLQTLEYVPSWSWAATGIRKLWPFSLCRPDNIVCLFMVKSERFVNEPVYEAEHIRLNELNNHVSSVAAAVDNLDASSGNDPGASHSKCGADSGKFAYWVLLLQPVNDDWKLFRRVGMGLAYEKAWKSAGELRQFEIV